MFVTPIELAFAVLILLATAVVGYFVVKVGFQLIKALIVPAAIITVLAIVGLFVVEGGNALGYWQVDTSSLSVYIPDAELPR